MSCSDVRNPAHKTNNPTNVSNRKREMNLWSCSINKQHANIKACGFSVVKRNFHFIEATADERMSFHMKRFFIVPGWEMKLLSWIVHLVISHSRKYANHFAKRHTSMHTSLHVVFVGRWKNKQLLPFGTFVVVVTTAVNKCAWMRMDLIMVWNSIFTVSMREQRTCASFRQNGKFQSNGQHFSTAKQFAHEFHRAIHKLNLSLFI